MRESKVKFASAAQLSDNGYSRMLRFFPPLSSYPPSKGLKAGRVAEWRWGPSGRPHPPPPPHPLCIGKNCIQYASGIDGASPLKAVVYFGVFLISTDLLLVSSWQRGRSGLDFLNFLSLGDFLWFPTFVQFPPPPPFPSLHASRVWLVGVPFLGG